jgi:hypothetical protein
VALVHQATLADFPSEHVSPEIRREIEITRHRAAGTVTERNGPAGVVNGYFDDVRARAEKEELSWDELLGEESKRE